MSINYGASDREELSAFYLTNQKKEGPGDKSEFRCRWGWRLQNGEDF